MIRDNQRVFNWIHVVFDAAVTVVSYIIAWYIKFQILPTVGDALPKSTYFSALYFIVPLYLALYYASGLYANLRICTVRI